MLKLTNLQHTENHMKAVYEVIHGGGDEFKTTLTQNLHVSICSKTGAVDAEFHFTELKAPSMDEALAKLAIWCDRMAAALREPRKVVASVPVFEKDWEAVRDENSSPMGLTWERLQALLSGAGMTAEDIREGSDELHEHEYIRCPQVDVKYLPLTHLDDVPDVLATLENAFPGITGGRDVRPNNPVFLSPFPYARGALVPLPNENRTAQNFFALSQRARDIYRVIAQAYVECICLPPTAKVDAGPLKKTVLVERS